MEDEYHLLLKCSIYNVIHQKYDDLLDGHDNLSVVLKYCCIWDRPQPIIILK